MTAFIARNYRGIIIKGMSILRSLFLVAVCCPLAMQAQGQTSADVPFGGCYRVVSQRWHPMNEDATPIPDRFQLLSQPTGEPSRGLLAMRSVPAHTNATENSWGWQPRGSRLWISWGNGLHGFRGTLKRSQPGEFVGKVKEWCDSRCGWKTQVATIRIQKTDCTE